MLEDLFIADRINLISHTSGMDSREHCVDKSFFDHYPYQIKYSYNSRGFRDAEWPAESELGKSIWCLGDSFTQGLGLAHEHTWPQQLQARLAQRCINVSLDGGSNQWIARRAVQILTAVCPDLMVLQWSFLHRRELDIESAAAACWKDFYNTVRDSSWPDCDNVDELSMLPEYIQSEIKNVHGYPHRIANDVARRAWFEPCSDHDDYLDFVHAVNSVEACKQHCCVIHSVIPDYAPEQIKKSVNLFFEENNINWLGEIQQLDRARDGYHYGVQTTAKIAQDIERIWLLCKKY